MKYLILATALLAMQATAQSFVTIDGNEYLLNVDKLEMSSRRVFICEDGIEPVFQPTDFDRDGDDDDACVIFRGDTCEGISYDPCKHSDWARQLDLNQMLGAHCYSKAECAAKLNPEEVCDGFSPTPPGCDP